jgi:general secretion pathway protein L
MVTVTATSRAMHAAAVAAVTAAGPESLRLVRPASGDGGEVVLPVAVADLGTERARIGRTVTIGLAAVALAAAIAGWWYVTAAADLEAQANEIEERLDGHRRRLAPSASGPGASDRDLLVTLSRETPMSVIALENLSAALPDDTHLTSLQIARGKLRLGGVTRDITALTTALEASTAFADPVSAAPTVRAAGGDRFTLDLKVTGAEATGR